MKIYLLIFVFLQLACAHQSPSHKEKFTLRIMHTNDHHGKYLADQKGQYGMAPRKFLIDELRRESLQQKGFSLLLSGGDINTGTMESDMFDAKPDFLGMKYIGYDAMAVGNHEFDNSFEVIKQQQKWGGFPFLSANIFYKGTQKRVFNPAYILREYRGFKIAIFGLTTVDTPFKASNQKAREQFEFRNIITTAKELVKELEPKVDMIIAVTHVGHHGSLTSNGDIQLAQSVPEIDVVVGGHSQEIIHAQRVGNAVIVQAQDWGKYVGVLDIQIREDNSFLMQKDKGFQYRLIPVNHAHKVSGRYVIKGRTLPADHVLEALFLSYRLKAEAKGSQVIGKIDQGLDGNRKKLRTSQVAIGQFFGAALMNKVKQVDGVIFNSGSIRSGLDAGEITWKDLHRLHPYGNTICTVNLSAKEFYDYVNRVAMDNVFLNIPQGSYPQLVNMQLVFKQKVLQEIRGKDWHIKNMAGKIVGSKKTFTLGTMNFLAGGGDNYPHIVEQPSFVDTGFMINAAMKEYVEKYKKLQTQTFERKAQNRIIHLK